MKDFQPFDGFSDNPAAVLEALYERVYEQEMKELSICNPQVRVEAVEFKVWEGQWVGAVVTPWFINLYILHRQGESWPELKLGKGNEIAIEFPAGVIKFTPRFEPELGYYLCCSLVSPMGDYDNHAQAVQAAIDAVRQLTAIPLLDTTAQQPDTVQQHEPISDQEPLSRRDFLRGKRPETEREPEQVPIRNAREGLDAVNAALKL
ncbi:[NiFe]-hydrogenase assembly, chaperone, HybE [Motiliproteus coralliicola]|uniref:[NiFe]-hydrogenase assembly, chaperone, HybE n=1 Tax=Motiliproteus coralliicola TaxID=2283196 RepID=A0A369WGS4_9GAMM|nr:[NiFe]-hydrogenase assembly chaperone HybE [Motiliproteus coralliicola]RDE19816.1 [NiFe]-hydrogenase assembly, chaperone, HybE [Motiliproteus coralliicola]